MSDDSSEVATDEINWEFGIARGISGNSDLILGHGYDMTGKYADVSYIRGPVLSYNKLFAAGHIDTTDPVLYVKDATNFESISGNKASEYQTSLAQKLGIEANGEYGSVASFSAEVNTAFNQNKTSFTNYTYHTIRYRNPTRIYYIKATPFLVDTSFLDTNFKAALAQLKRDSTTATATKVINTFGTHVMWGGMWGARFDYNMSVMRRSSESSVDISEYVKAKAAATFGLASVGGSVNHESAENARSKIFEETVHDSREPLGGNENLAVLLKDSATSTAAAFNNWLASITDENRVWIDFYTGMGGYPVEITEFIADTALKSLVRRTLDTLYKKRGIIIANQDAPPSHNATVDFTVNPLKGGPGPATCTNGDCIVNTSATRGSAGWAIGAWVSSNGGTHLTLHVEYAVEEYKDDKTRLYFEKDYDLDLVAMGAIQANERIQPIERYCLSWFYGGVQGQHEDFIPAGQSDAYMTGLWVRVDGPGPGDDYYMDAKFNLRIPFTTL